jgi:maltose O-acetyltransferase
LYNKNSSTISFCTTLIILKKKLLKTLIRFIPGNSLRIILLRACGYKIGKKVYIGEDLIVSEVLEDFSEKLIIEDRVAIAQRVTFVTASDPNYSLLWNHVKIIRGKIIIKHDAWIGVGVIILPNVTIGEFSIVGAGAVVTKDVPPYTIVAGIPAIPIKKIKISGNKDKNES